VLEDCSEEIEDYPRSGLLRDFRWIVNRGDLDEVEPNDCAASGQSTQEVDALVVRKAARRRGAGPGHQCWIESITIDRHVVAGRFWDSVENCIDPDPTELARADYDAARASGCFDVRATARAGASDANLRQSTHVFHFRDPAHRVTVTLANSELFVCKIHVRI
jgi:hypothetical protein